MSNLSPAQIAAYVRGAGFPEELVPKMTAIALAESSGNPRAHNPNAGTGDNSYGLFQVNMIGGMGPERRRQFGMSSNEELFDPAKNAAAARKIYESQGLGAWSVHRSGADKRFIEQAQQAVSGSLASAGAGLMQQPSSQAMGLSPGSLAAQILSSFRGTGGGLPGVSAPPRLPSAGAQPRTPEELAGHVLRTSFAQEAGLSPRRMAASNELMGPLSVAAFGQGRDRVNEILQSVIGQASGIGTSESQGIPAPAGVAASIAGSNGGEKISLVDFGRRLREASGLKLAENAHPDLGGRVGGHSPGSLHYQRGRKPDGSEFSLATDITDWRVPSEDRSVWGPRKAALEQEWRAVIGDNPNVELYGPASDPRGHGEHIHLGLRDGYMPASMAEALIQAEQRVRQRFPLRG
jgi:hypothetical protein